MSNIKCLTVQARTKMICSYLFQILGSFMWMLHLHKTHSTNCNDEVRNLFMENILSSALHFRAL